MSPGSFIYDVIQSRGSERLEADTKCVSLYCKGRGGQCFVIERDKGQEACV